MMMTLFKDKSNEFSKLTPVDQDLCIYLLDSNPHALRSWVEYVVADYQKKGLTVDGIKLLKELTDFADTVKRLDNERD